MPLSASAVRGVYALKNRDNNNRYIYDRQKGSWDILRLLVTLVISLILLLSFAAVLDRANKNKNEQSSIMAETSNNLPETDEGKLNYYIANTRSSISSLNSNVLLMEDALNNKDLEAANEILLEMQISFDSIGYMLPYDIYSYFEETDSISEELKEELWGINEKFEDGVMIDNDSDLTVMSSILSSVKIDAEKLSNIFESEYNSYLE